MFQILKYIAGYFTILTGIIFSGYSVIMSLLMIKNEYSSYNTPNTVKVIYDHIIKDMWICNENIIWKNKQCPKGVIIGRKFIAYVDMYRNGINMDLEITVHTFRFFKNTFESSIINNISEIEQGEMFNNSCIELIPLLYKKDVNYNSYWEIMNVIPFRSLNDVPEKSIETCSNIMNIIKNQNYIGGVYLLSGPPGTGKTMTTRLLAVKLHASICLDFNPTRPANKLLSLISSNPPTKNRPIIIVIEEVDKIFNKLGHIVDHNTFSTQVMDKDDWNNMLDFVGMADNVILIITSNITISELRKKYDPSLIRNYRVKECFEF
jgi:hypothetical protein